MNDSVLAEPGVVARWVGWAIIESMTLVLLSLITLLVTARLLGPANFGIASSVIAIIAVLNTAVEGLFGEAIVQRAKLDDEHIDTALFTAFGVAAVIVLVCAIGGGPLATLFGEPEMAPLLRVASLGLLFSGYGGVQSALLRRAFGFRKLALRTLLARVASCIITLIMAVHGCGAWSLIAQYLVGTALGAAALWYFSPRPFRWHYSPQGLRDLWRFAGPWLANEIVQVNLPRIYQVAAAYLFGPYQFGLLGMGFRIADTMRELIGNVANNVGLPIFARSQHDMRELARRYASATATVCTVALPCFAGLAICASAVVDAVLGQAWLSAVPLLQVLAVGAGIGFIANMAYTAFAAVGRPAFALPLSLFEGVLSITLLLSLAHLGIVAAALAWAFRQVVSVVLLQALCLRVLPLRLVDMAKALWRPLLLVMVFSTAVWLARDWTSAAFGPPVRLILLAAEAGAILVMSVALVRPDLIAAAIGRRERREPI